MNEEQLTLINMEVQANMSLMELAMQLSIARNETTNDAVEKTFKMLRDNVVQPITDHKNVVPKV